MQIVNDKPDEELQSVGLASCPADLNVWLCSVMSDSCDPMDYSPLGQQQQQPAYYCKMTVVLVIEMFSVMICIFGWR